MILKKLLPFTILIFVFLFYSKAAFASTLYLSPASGNIGTGNVMYVQVRLNAGGDSVNGISAYLSYPADKVEVASISYGGSFGIAAEGSYGGGGIRISRGNISGVGGDVNIATIGFRGKSLGPVNVSFIGGSAAPRASDSSDSLSGTSGGTYNVAQGVSSSPKTPGGGNQQPLPETPKDTAKPIITDVKTTLITENSVTINWKTNEKTDSYIEYGLENNKYFLSATSIGLLTDHSLKIENPVLTPGAKIHFRVVAKDEAGNITVGDDKIFQLSGYSVTIKVVDKKQKPVGNAKILLYSDPQESLTNAQGEVFFKDVTLGKHLVVVKLNGAEKTQEIDVKESASQQIFNVIVDTSALNNNKFLIYALILLLIAIAFYFVYFNLIKKRSSKPESPPPVQAPPQN